MKSMLRKLLVSVTMWWAILTHTVDTDAPELDWWLDVGRPFVALNQNENSKL